MGISMIISRSKNWRPLSDAAPMYRNTPYNTGIGMWDRSGVNRTEQPIVRKIRM